MSAPMRWLLFTLVVVTGAPASAQPPAGSVLRPLAVLHTVADLNRSMAFYHDVIGLPLDAEPVFPSGSTPALQALTAAPGATVRAVSLAIPGSMLHLVLMQYAHTPQRHLRQRLQDPGVVKLVLRVRDIDRAFNTARPHLAGVYSTGGAPVHPEGPQAAIRAVVMRDPDGFALEFVLADASAQSSAPADSNIVGGWASLITQDQQQALSFYRRLGFQVRGGRPLPPSVLALEGTPTARVLLTATRPPGTPFTWFFYDFRGIPRSALHARPQDIGCPALAFAVTDLHSVLAALRAAGTRVITTGGKAVSAGEGQQAVFVRDPSGTPVEFVQ